MKRSDLESMSKKALRAMAEDAGLDTRREDGKLLTFAELVDVLEGAAAMPSETLPPEQPAAKVEPAPPAPPAEPNKPREVSYFRVSEASNYAAPGCPCDRLPQGMIVGSDTHDIATMLAQGVKLSPMGKPEKAEILSAPGGIAVLKAAAVGAQSDGSSGPADTEEVYVINERGERVIVPRVSAGPDPSIMAVVG